MPSRWPSDALEANRGAGTTVLARSHRTLGRLPHGARRAERPGRRGRAPSRRGRDLRAPSGSSTSSPADAAARGVRRRGRTRCRERAAAGRRRVASLVRGRHRDRQAHQGHGRPRDPPRRAGQGDPRQRAGGRAQGHARRRRRGSARSPRHRRVQGTPRRAERGGRRRRRRARPGPGGQGAASSTTRSSSSCPARWDLAAGPARPAPSRSSGCARRWRLGCATPFAASRASHPALGRHLGNSVRTGTFCSYQPETAITWRCQIRSGAPRA